MKIKSSLIAASLAALLGLPALSLADAPAAGRACEHAGDFQHGWNRLASRLGLSAEQRLAMNAIEDKYRPELRDLMQLSADNRAALAKMAASDPKLQETADAQGKTLADSILLRKKMRAEVDKVLTETQRQSLSQLQEERHNRWGGMHHRGDE